MPGIVYSTNFPDSNWPSGITRNDGTSNPQVSNTVSYDGSYSCLLDNTDTGYWFYTTIPDSTGRYQVSCYFYMLASMGLENGTEIQVFGRNTETDVAKYPYWTTAAPNGANGYYVSYKVGTGFRLWRRNANVASGGDTPLGSAVQTSAGTIATVDMGCWHKITLVITMPRSNTETNNIFVGFQVLAGVGDTNEGKMLTPQGTWVTPPTDGTRIFAREIIDNGGSTGIYYDTSVTTGAVIASAASRAGVYGRGKSGDGVYVDKFLVEGFDWTYVDEGYDWSSTYAGYMTTLAADHYWPMEDTSTTNAFAASRGAVELTDSGTITFNQNGPNGITRCATLGSDAFGTTDNLIPASEFGTSYSGVAWVYGQPIGAYGTILSFRSTSDPDPNLFYMYLNNVNIYINVKDNAGVGGSVVVAHSSVSYVSGYWYMIAFVRSGNDLTLYVSNPYTGIVSSNSSTISVSMGTITVDKLVVGATVEGSAPKAKFWNGKIAHVAIWKTTALSPTNIQDIYNKMVKSGDDKWSSWNNWYCNGLGQRLLFGNNPTNYYPFKVDATYDEGGFATGTYESATLAAYKTCTQDVDLKLGITAKSTFGVSTVFTHDTGHTLYVRGGTWNDTIISGAVTTTVKGTIDVNRGICYLAFVTPGYAVSITIASSAVFNVSKVGYLYGKSASALGSDSSTTINIAGGCVINVSEGGYFALINFAGHTGTTTYNGTAENPITVNVSGNSSFYLFTAVAYMMRHTCIAKYVNFNISGGTVSVFNTSSSDNGGSYFGILSNCVFNISGGTLTLSWIHASMQSAINVFDSTNIFNLTGGTTTISGGAGTIYFDCPITQASNANLSLPLNVSVTNANSNVIFGPNSKLLSSGYLGSLVLANTTSTTANLSILNTAYTLSDTILGLTGETSTNPWTPLPAAGSGAQSQPLVSGGALKKYYNDGNLKAYWRCSDGAGTQITDFSGNEKHMTITSPSGTGYAWAAADQGLVGPCIWFKGTDAYGSCGAVMGSGSPNTLPATWSIFFLVRSVTPAISLRTIALTYSDAGSGSKNFILARHHTSTAANLAISGTNNSDASWVSTNNSGVYQNFSVSVWQSVCVTHVESPTPLTNVYVNGILQASPGTTSQGTTYYDQTFIGAARFGSGAASYFESAYIQHVAVWNVALTQADVQVLHARARHGQTSAGTQKGEIITGYGNSTTMKLLSGLFLKDGDLKYYGCGAGTIDQRPTLESAFSATQTSGTMGKLVQELFGQQEGVS